MNSPSNSGLKIKIAMPALFLLIFVLYILSISSFIKRGMTLRSLQWHNIGGFLSLILFFMHVLFSMLAASNGLGQHPTSLAPPQIVKATLLELIAYTCYILNVPCIKYTIVGFQTKLFAVEPYLNLFRYAIWPLVPIIAILSLFVAITNFIRCIPPTAIWKYDTVPPSCISDYQYTCLAITLSVLSVIADIILAMLPVLALYRLHRPTQKKRLACILLVAGGCSATICGGLHAWSLTGFNSRADFTYTAVNLNVWGAVTNAIPIIAYYVANSSGILFHRIKRPMTRATENRPIQPASVSLRVLPPSRDRLDLVQAHGADFDLPQEKEADNRLTNFCGMKVFVLENKDADSQ